MVETKKVLGSAVDGFLKGVSVDSLLWAASAYIPQLAEESPIRIPGWHPPYPEAKTHWDDIIGIAISAGVIAYGAVKKEANTVIEGASMIAGEWIISKFQPLPVKPFGEATVATKEFEDLVKVE